MLQCAFFTACAGQSPPPFGRTMHLLSSQQAQNGRCRCPHVLRCCHNSSEQVLACAHCDAPP